MKSMSSIIIARVFKLQKTNDIIEIRDSTN